LTSAERSAAGAIRSFNQVKVHRGPGVNVPVCQISDNEATVSSNGHAGIVVLLTSLPIEYEAVRTWMHSLYKYRHDSGTVFEIGWFPGSRWKVAIAQIGEGNLASAIVAERAIREFRPRAVLFVGVAGGLKADIRLGDVVVATQVYSYHGGREHDGEFLVRPRSWPMAHELEQEARRIDQTAGWHDMLPYTGRKPLVHFKPIAAGEVVLDSTGSGTAERLRMSYNDAAAVEMEGAGLAQVAHLNLGTPVLVVRGISDLADGEKRLTDAAGWQYRASTHAAAMALAIVREIQPKDFTDAESAPT
jgi:nucleoside phosphorylase